MGEDTLIGWTDHTFNPWWGCTAISAGCDNCYAETFDHRIGGDHFGHGKPRKTMSDAYWKRPLAWDRKAKADGIRRKVFCGSMCDWLDHSVDLAHRERLFELIKATPNLDWLLLTKRGAALQMGLWLPLGTKCQDFVREYPNVWMGVTVEDADARVRIHQLRETPARVRFLSCEPLLGYLGGDLDLTGIDWVIVGGESGPGARPMKLIDAVSIQRQCSEQGVAFFFKQHGGRGKDKGGCLIGGKEVKEFPQL